MQRSKTLNSSLWKDYPRSGVTIGELIEYSIENGPKETPPFRAQHKLPRARQRERFSGSRKIPEHFNAPRESAGLRTKGAKDSEATAGNADNADTSSPQAPEENERNM